jgi:acetyl esterase/lipase
MHHRTAANLAREAGANVVMVTYRLAPKYPFPHAFLDAVAVWEYVALHALDFGIDSSRIAVAGESAGGNLSAAVSLYEKDHLGKMPTGALLMYPALDQGQDSGSRKKFTDTPMIASDNFTFVNQYFYRDGYGEFERYAVPLRHPDVAGLPPTYIETAEFDPLSDDGRNYAEKLAKAGVDVMFWPTKGTIHGYDIVRTAAITQLCMTRRIEWFQRIFSIKN